MTAAYAIDPLICDTCYGSLEIEGAGGGLVPMANEYGAWCTPDLSPLWGVPTTAGENWVVPGADGRLANPQWVDETRYSLPFSVVGSVDGLTGAEMVHDPYVGLQGNVAYLQANLLLRVDPEAARVTRTARFVLPDGTPRLAEVQLLAAEVQLHPGGLLHTTLEILVVSGTLTVGVLP